MQNYNVQTAIISSASKFPCATFTVAFSLLLFVFIQQPALALTDAPTQQIKETVDKILVILKSNQEAEWTVTRQKISEILQKRFDYARQSRLVLHNHWKELNNEEQNTFISLFSELQKYVYLDKLKQYSDEKVEFTKQKIKNNKALVFSSIANSTENINIVYRLYKKQDQWLVYDVIIDGISLIKNYRKQFSAIIDDESFSGLITKLEKKINTIIEQEKGNKSKTGKYQSYNITILVHSDDDRHGLFSLFKDHQHVAMVL